MDFHSAWPAFSPARGGIEELSAIGKAEHRPRNAIAVAFLRYGLAAYCKAKRKR